MPCRSGGELQARRPFSSVAPMLQSTNPLCPAVDPVAFVAALAKSATWLRVTAGGFDSKAKSGISVMSFSRSWREPRHFGWVAVRSADSNSTVSLALACDRETSLWIAFASCIRRLTALLIDPLNMSNPQDDLDAVIQGAGFEFPAVRIAPDTESRKGSFENADTPATAVEPRVPNAVGNAIFTYTCSSWRCRDDSAD